MNTVKEDKIIEVISHRFSIDWTYDDKHKINLKDIWGMELHWRGDSWHVVVVTKEKDKQDHNITYELSHWVSFVEVRKLVANSDIRIRKIVNYYNSDNFIKEIKRIMPND